MRVHVNTDGFYFTETRVWIDWNQNCSFEDAGEIYDLGDAFNETNGATENSPLSVTVPANALTGTTIMRVSTKFNSAPGSCETGFDGEVEDYTINVQSMDISENSFENFTVWPNPNNGQFTVRLTSFTSTKISVGIFDLRGRKVFQEEFQNTGKFDQQINTENLQTGVYLLKVNDGKRTAVKKLIVE